MKTNPNMNGQDAPCEILCVGELLWDLHVPQGTQLSAANHVSFEAGGSAPNVAKHLVKLGLRAGVLGVVGEDPLGTALLERLTRERIDVRYVQKMTARTGLVLISNDPPVAVGYRAADEEAQAFRQALNGEYAPKILHFASILPNRTAIHALTKAAQRARRAGSIVTVDANMRPRLWRNDSAFKTNPFELLEVADVVKLSREDLEMLREEHPEILRDRLRDEVILIVTNGSEPTHAWGPRGHVKADVLKLDMPMAVGAGDAFFAGCLATMFDLHPRLWAAPNELEGILAKGNAVARMALDERQTR